MIYYKLREFIDENKLNWVYLSGNSNAIELLKENPDKISWISLSLNKNIFTYDYKKIKEVNKELLEDLHAEFWHPRRVNNWLNKGNKIKDYLINEGLY